MNKKVLITALLVASAAASQASFTVANFFDPTTSGSQVMFTFDMDTMTLFGEWQVDGLTVETPGFVGGGQVQNARFTMGPVGVTEVIAGTLYTINAGEVKFWTSDPSTPFFTIDFGSGQFLNPFVAGASELRGDVVDFSGPNVPGGLSQEQFAFNFANTNRVGNKFTYTAAFTSSAVPEPATLLVLGSAIGMLAARRRAAR